MLAWQLADKWLKQYSTETMGQVFSRYFSGGLVHVTPDVFLLAHEVHWDDSKQQIQFDNENTTAWFVELAASRMPHGAIREFMRIAPRRQKWCLWKRRNEERIRSFEWDKLEQKVRI